MKRILAHRLKLQTQSMLKKLKSMQTKNKNDDDDDDDDAIYHHFLLAGMILYYEHIERYLKIISKIRLFIDLNDKPTCLNNIPSDFSQLQDLIQFSQSIDEYNGLFSMQVAKKTKRNYKINEVMVHMLACFFLVTLLVLGLSF